MIWIGWQSRKQVITQMGVEGKTTCYEIIALYSAFTNSNGTVCQLMKAYIEVAVKSSFGYDEPLL